MQGDNKRLEILHVGKQRKERQRNQEKEVGEGGELEGPTAEGGVEQVSPEDRLESTASQPPASCLGVIFLLSSHA